ncbi:hypothetical protein BGZ83_011498 [Gryganskiella cystojenkinii]|nr:hypothetical protein BGZ83_011498 [Gryganskiella cystojenkinii]
MSVIDETITGAYGGSGAGVTEAEAGAGVAVAVVSAGTGIVGAFVVGGRMAVLWGGRVDTGTVKTFDVVVDLGIDAGAGAGGRHAALVEITGIVLGAVVCVCVGVAAVLGTDTRAAATTVRVVAFVVADAGG